MSELLSVQSSKAVNKEAGREKLKPHTVSPRLAVPAHIMRPPYVDTGKNPFYDEVQVHDAESLVKMRAACKLAAQVLEYAGTLVQPGVTTDAIDKAVHQMIIDNGAYPSPLTYGNFPKSVCTSVNECICHGIPDSRGLANGDIINIDVTVYLNGYHGDTSRMFFVGSVSDSARRLCETTKQCLDAAIMQCGPGVPVSRIGQVIHEMGERAKLGVVPNFVGHGVGWHFHSAPVINHVRNREPGVMVPGLTFTIEPMLVEGTTRSKTWRDDWTVVTADGKLAAQYEHTILITKGGHEVLTVA
ncbi:hypothetical protein WJX81_000402 [Elliptochloris bilobata]|uniref:Methionine aminopeptidase n=1 Tax=Elliptochloris bilobata TaxID=381761 RepID=A0AAW1SI23_9CHLO